ncbi:MAG: hypothetical protein E7543_09385 [Ruminococcaceae bacterium]|nr:hypothetical protein [Oscillospiraceae bacterium]
MKKTLSLLIALIIFASSFCMAVYALSQAYTGLTSAQTPTTNASLLFSKKFGGSYKAAPTPPIVVGDTILLMSGVKLYKLNAETGEEIASVKMEGSTLYATVPPLYADGKVFVALDDGIIQAFDYETMKSLWVYTDSIGGQAISPITYDNGYIYTGFWVDETEYANYVCLDASDENIKTETESKSAEWTYKALGGFYWAGCCVTDKYLVVGKDDGKKNSENSSKIISLNKSTGKAVSSLSVTGDIRSSVVYSAEADTYYASSKAGYVYKFSMDSAGKLSSLKTYKASGAVTATPVIYNGRLYSGCQNGSTGKFIVLDAKTMKEIYTCDMLGYPQASMLVSTGYEEATGKVHIYSTYNAKPGGITVFEDSQGQTSAVKTELYTPESDMQQYCISTISAGEYGTLYYKNDSGNIFALTEAKTGVQSILQRIITMIKNIIAKIMALLSNK